MTGFPDPGVLTGERVVLRPQRDADADPLGAAFLEDREMGRLVGFTADPTPEWFREHWKTNEAARVAGERLARVTADPATDEPGGTILLYGLDAENRRCELGVWLVPRARGRGMATEAMRLLCRWAFGATDLQRIGLRTLPDNEPMLRLAERAGFTYEGVLRRYSYERGRAIDNAVCSLLREEIA